MTKLQIFEDEGRSWVDVEPVEIPHLVTPPTSFEMEIQFANVRETLAARTVGSKIRISGECPGLYEVVSAEDTGESVHVKARWIDY